MGGPSKRRAQAEKKPSGSSGSGNSSNDTQGKPKNVALSLARLDGNRDPSIPKGGAAIEYSRPNDLKNISEFLGMAGWFVARGYAIPDSLPLRPSQPNNFGREVFVQLNAYNVAYNPQGVVQQYDVAWGSNTDPTKRALVKKIWNSKAVQDAIGPQHRWIYDGNKLAWCGKRLERDELRVTVNLDVEQGRKNPSDKNVHQVFIRHTRQIDYASLAAFLNGTANWSTQCIDTINFLDHVLREEPSRKYTQIKKSFFQRGEARFDLGGGVEAFKGVFASLRPVSDDNRKPGLAINVDVANGTFWRKQELLRAASQVFNCSLSQFQARFKEAQREWRKSIFRKDCTKFNRIGVTAIHDKENPTQWTIDSFYHEDVHGAKFPDPNDRDTPPEARRKISVYDYFVSKYNLTPRPGIPVVKMTKKIRGGPVFIPMDYLVIDDNQRYNTKLSDTQTSQMIKFAVTLPAARKSAIQYGVNLLDWARDPNLIKYGIKVNPNPTRVKARILPSPMVGFGPANNPAKIDPKDLVAGRWRLDGKKFFTPNTKEIGAWGVVVITGRGSVSKEATEAFVKNFIKIYEGHGGRFNPRFKQPHICQGNLMRGGEMVADAYNSTGNAFQSRPTFMMFVVTDRNVEVYRRIKKACDCRFGLPSQVLQSKHVYSNSPQYISNVCMKVNAKLGGCTSMTKSGVIPKVNSKAASLPTMVVGADVSHPAPGAGSEEKASFAAITVSSDAQFVRYWAQCQTNGNRVEMVTTQNIHDHFGDMARMWMQRVSRGMAPKRVLFIRDGVSEGQYQAVLEEEVRDMKETFSKLGVKELPKFAVVIAGKRHHVRFFPEKGDRNGNPIPGTLVETGCTHPFEFDFYLCSHVAIKGTARPIHYQCILNEGNEGEKWHPAELQSFLFEHSYQYVRSTTPVSLHPAVYYAHLAADRARAHANENPVSSGKKETKAEQRSTTGSSTNRSVEVAPLIPMGQAQGLKEVMWYI